MLFLSAVLLAVVLGYAFGGRLKNLGALHVRYVGLVMIALVIQLLVFPLFSDRPIIPFGTTAFHTLSYVLVFAFLVFNLKLWPLLAVGAGALLNVVVIAVNGGRMPVSMDALEATGAVTMVQYLTDSPIYGNVVRMSDATRMNFLGDVLYFPEWFPLATAFSAGDVLIIIGLVWLIVKGMRCHG